MLNATLPAMVTTATGSGEVIVMNGSQEHCGDVIANLSWLFRVRTDWRINVIKEKEHCGITGLMLEGYRRAQCSIVAFMHDDTMVHEYGWDDRIARAFEYGDVGLVGFGGCTRLELVDGTVHTAGEYFSNWDDAEFYGKRTLGSCDVAHVDGSALCVRGDRSKLTGMFGGEWENFTVYDSYLSLLAREAGYKVRVVGIKSAHLSWLRGNGHHRRDARLAYQSSILRRSKGYDLSISRKYLAQRFHNLFPVEVRL